MTRLEVGLLLAGFTVMAVAFVSVPFESFAVPWLVATVLMLFPVTTALCRAVDRRDR